MTDKQRIEHIVILMAMQEEANSLIDALELVEVDGLFPRQLPFRCFQSSKIQSTQFSTIKISLITSGKDQRYEVDNIGCEAATLMTHQAIQQLSPDLIISAGTAGGFAERGAEIGSIYVAKDYFVFHDRIVPLPGFEQVGVGYFPALELGQMVKQLGFGVGVISTGSSLEKNPKDQRVIKAHPVVAKEMEAAAIAWVASLYQVPMTAIKSITNLVDLDNRSEHEFVKNFELAVSGLTSAMIKVLHYFNQKDS